MKPPAPASSRTELGDVERAGPIGLRELRVRHHDAIDHDARHLHVPRVERAAFGDALDLRDHDAARVARRHCDRERLERQRLLLHRLIAVGIASRCPDDPDIDRERLVEEAFLAIDVDQADGVLCCPCVELAAAIARLRPWAPFASPE